MHNIFPSVSNYGILVARECIITHNSLGMYTGFTFRTWSVASLLRIWFRIRFRITGRKSGEVEALKPPYVVIGNHGNKWDPFIAAVLLKEVICYIASDSIFRNPVLRVILKSFGAVPKKKFMPDTQAIRELFRIRSDGGIIGIFPEGEATWDGNSLDVTQATGKLLKVLKMPVVLVKFTGNYLSLPRWSRYGKKGELTADYSVLLTAEQLAAMTPEEINTSVYRGIHHDEYAAQRELPVRFVGKRRAEYLENTLFVCPRCKSLCSLVSHKDGLVCTECGNGVVYTEYGTFVPADPADDTADYEDPAVWNRFQTGHLRALHAGADENEILFCDHAVLFMCESGQELAPADKGEFGAEKNAFVFSGENLSFRFTLTELQGVNIQTNEKFEFYWKDPESGKTFLVRPDFGSMRVSSYKWYLLWRIAAESPPPGGPL